MESERVSCGPGAFARSNTPTDVVEALRCRIAPLAAWADRVAVGGELETERIALGILELEADIEAAACRVRELLE